MVIGFCHALPFAIEFEEQKEVSEVNRTAPPLFENPHNGYGLLNGKDIYAGFKVCSGTYGIDIVVELNIVLNVLGKNKNRK